MVRSAASRSGKPRLVLVLTAAYVVFLGALAVNHVLHEAWRDELQAFDLARQSASLGDMCHRARCEPHPLLWHMILYAGVKLYP